MGACMHAMEAITPSISKKPTNFEACPSLPEVRLSIFMVHVAGGASFQDVALTVRFSLLPHHSSRPDSSG